jgi:hypothetical protein
VCMRLRAELTSVELFLHDIVLESLPGENSGVYTNLSPYALQPEKQRWLQDQRFFFQKPSYGTLLQAAGKDEFTTLLPQDRTSYPSYRLQCCVGLHGVNPGSFRCRDVRCA